MVPTVIEILYTYLYKISIYILLYILYFCTVYKISMPIVADRTVAVSVV